MAPFENLCFGSWSFAGGKSSYELNGTIHELNWSPGNADGEFVCQDENGKWTLHVEIFSSRRAVIHSRVELNEPVRHLVFKLLDISGLKFVHLTTGGMKMGSCSIFQAPAEADGADFESFYNCTLSENGSSLVISHPLEQSQMSMIRGRMEKEQLSLAICSEVDFFSGTEIGFPPITFEYGDAITILQEYADCNIGVRREIPAPEYGWNSWDYYRWTVSESEVLKNAEFIARDPVLSKHIKRIIVDDGWQYCYGEWYANCNFPSGMKALAAEIRRMGFTPGLWVAPSAVEPHARIAQLEYDMLACSEGGQPCLAFQCMRRYGFILDPTVDKSRKFLRELFDRLVGEGFGYFKLDFLASTLSAAQFADKSVPRSQIVNCLMQSICEGVNGRAEILGCNYPFMTGNRYVSAVRVGSDIHATWNGAKANAVNVAYRFWMNKKLWLSDPDFALCRGTETSDHPDALQPCLVFCDPGSGYDQFYERRFDSAKMSEIEVLLSITLMTGGAVNLSDDLTLLNEAGLDLARKVVSAESGSAAIPVDLFVSKMPSRWVQQLSRGKRVLVINWGDEAAEFSLDFAGVMPDKVSDFWRGKLISRPERIILAPHSCLLLEW